MNYPVASQSILQNWVMELPLRHQGCLLTAIRGCDGLPKENSAKPIVRALRGVCLNPADAREMEYPSAFMTKNFTQEEFTFFLKNWDEYPIHFILHLLHAIEIVGYKHPNGKIKRKYLTAYHHIVYKFHLNVEEEKQMDERFTENRIDKYNNSTGDKEVVFD